MYNTVTKARHARVERMERIQRARTVRRDDPPIQFIEVPDTYRRGTYPQPTVGHTVYYSRTSPGMLDTIGTRIDIQA